MDLKDDGDFKLVVADHQSCRLKIYQGTNVIYTSDLKTKPIAVEIVYGTAKKPYTPMIAVACESSIMFFKDFAPHMKFDMPPIVFSEQEMSIWSKLPEEP